jgi:MinD-like ATPase involved in chromosome partitioning or flagellar assembly
MRADIEKIYGVPVAGIMPLTEDMVENQSSDIFSLAYPDHPWSKGVKEVAENLLALYP